MVITENQVYTNPAQVGDDEQLVIQAIRGHEVTYRKKHIRPVRDDFGRLTQFTESYYVTYTIGLDMATRHVENKFWILSTPVV